MVLRHALLALLAHKPASGFDLVRRFRATAGFAWYANHSQIYPELARCLAEGLIREVGGGPRRKRIYETTAKGRSAVKRWLTTTQPERSARNEAALRSFFTWLIPPDAAEAFYASEAEYFREQLSVLEGIRAKFEPDWRDDPEAVARRITLERGLRYARSMLDWAEWAVDQMQTQSLRPVPGSQSMTGRSR